MNENHYHSRQAKAEADYREAYATWRAGMTPAERFAAAQLGVLGAHIDARGVGCPERDIERMADRSAEHAAAPAPDPLEGVNLELLEEMIAERVLAGKLEVMRVIVGEWLSADKSKLSGECFALISGISYTGNSETEIARKHGVTRAAVSKRCIDLAIKLGIETPRAMKSAASRIAYAAARRKVVRDEF